MKFTIVLDCDIETAEISNFILDCQQRFSGLIVEHFHGSEFYFTGTEDVLRDFILNYYDVFATEKDVQYFFDTHRQI